MSTGHRSHRALFDNTFDRLHYEGAHQVPPELYAAAGYLVLMVNPRGDPSYSPAYQEALREGWAAPTRYDILSGVDEVIRLGYADSTRLGVCRGGFPSSATCRVSGALRGGGGVAPGQEHQRR